MGTEGPKFPLKCGRCGTPLLDSLDIAIHIKGLKSDIYSLLSRCRLKATEKDVTQVNDD